MKVRTRIAVGLSLLIVLVLGALVLQSLIVLHLRDVTLDLKDSKLPATKDTRDLIQQLERLYRAASFLSQGHLWDDDLTGLEYQFSNLVEARRELTERLGLLDRFVAGAAEIPSAEPCRLKPSLEEVASRWEAYTELAAEIEEAFPDRSPPPDLDRLAGRVSPKRHDEFKRSIDTLTRAIDCVVQNSVGRAVDQSERAVGLSTVLTVVAVAASLWAGIWMVRSVTGPLAALTRAHRQWMQEDFSHQVDVPPGGKDEFSELAGSGNAMAQRLEQLDELKKDFLSHVSHELKSPLNAIQSSAQMLLRDNSAALTPRQRRRLQLMLENGERLSRNVLNLLDYSRLEAGVFTYQFGEQDLVPVLHRYLESLEPTVLEEGLRLEKRIPVGRPARLNCDAERLLQVVGNLVDNALKFSPPGSGLAIRLEIRDEPPDSLPAPLDSAGPFALISVIDSGPGVPEDLRKSIFAKFYQATGSRKGVGLGLAICRKIVEAHQGQIWYEDNPDGGAVFQVLLPMAISEVSRQEATTQKGGVMEAGSQEPAEAQKLEPPEWPGSAQEAASGK